MRRLWQVAVGLAFWVLFGWLWIDLIGDGKASGAVVSASLERVALVAIVVLTINLAWVAHNVRIHRRKGPRRDRPLVSPRTDEDRLGRPIVWGLPGGHAAALTTPHLVVTIEGGTKTYRRAEAAYDPAWGG